MKFFVDTANVDEIRKANDMGIICGVTTNPSLIAKEGRDFNQVIAEIASIVDGPISGEVKATTTDAEGMIKEGREIATIHPNMVVKIPMTVEGIARLSNMLGGGVIVQRFGDLVRGRRSTQKRIEENMFMPTLSATPGDLSLVLPKRILDGIIEMIYALDKIAPGTANDDTLLYGVEVKFYNMEVDVDENLESRHKGLYIIGDGSGVTHSLSHASASGVYVARKIAETL